MKKTVFLLALCLMATTAMAEATCDGGTLITANKYDSGSSNNVEGCNSNTCKGKTFCKSDTTMNWWSAHAWCRSNGRKLASRSVACPNVTDGCPNLKGIGDEIVWTSSVFSSPTNAFHVNLSSGAISYNGRGFYFPALCE